MGAYGNSKGVAYVIYGGPTLSFTDIGLASFTTLDPATTGFTIIGESVGDQLGACVDTAGDINQDGYADIIIGAPGKNVNQGAVYVIYGAERSSLSHIDLSSTPLDPSSTGFKITGEFSQDLFGASTHSAGDINKDGYDDIIIGAYGQNGNTGAVYAIYGGPKSSLPNINLGSTPLNPASNGFTFKGVTSGDTLGRWAATAGDVDNDGYDDIIFGAYLAFGYAGAAYVVYGGPKSSSFNTDLTALVPGSTGFIVKGNAVGDLLGASVRTAGDINNDGFDDIIIGAANSNSKLGKVYVIHSGCITTDCTSCVSRICEIFDLGYGLDTNSLCETCPNNCYQCQYSSSCLECNSPYFLYQSWCLPSCPTRTFRSDDKCQDCPLFCSSCTSLKSCQTCDQGYTLSDSLCIAPPSYPATEAKATQTIASSVRGIGSFVAIRSAMSPMTALVSKIVQSTRYLNLSVTEELAEIYKTWSTELISWDVPNMITKFDHFDTSPSVFSRYDLDSSFLANFWATLMTLLLGVAIFVTFYVVQKLFENARYDNRLSSLVRKLVAGSFNFALVLAYDCFCDILFYLVLDFKTNPFNTFFCWASFFSAVGFLGLGCFLVFFNIWKVRQYQRIKRNTADIQVFNERNKKWELFYSDFNDEDLWSESTLALLVVRSSLSSILTTTLYEYPLMQTAFFIIMDGAVILFLYFKNPFVTLRGRLAQYYFEGVTLLVHLCTFMLAMQDTFPTSSETLREILSTGIIYLNTAVISGSLSFMSIEIYKTISNKNRAAKLKKSENIIKRDDTMEAQTMITQPQIEIHGGSHSVNTRRQVISPETSHLNSSMNTDDTNYRINQQRIHNLLPIRQKQLRSRPQKTKPLKKLALVQRKTRNLPKD